MPFLKRRQTVRALDAINLTSLLDVTFTLLLAFMMVAPTLKSGLKMDLPQVKETETLPLERKNFTISIRKLDDPALPPARLYLDEKAVGDLDDLRKRLEEIHSRYSPNVDILIEADRRVPCETLLRVLAATRGAGIESIGVVTEPERETRR